MLYLEHEANAPFQGVRGDKHSQKHVQTAPSTAWLEALTYHTSLQMCSVFWLQRTVSDQSYRINKSDNGRIKGRQRPRSLASVSPLINLSYTAVQHPQMFLGNLSPSHQEEHSQTLHTYLSPSFPYTTTATLFFTPLMTYFLSWDVFL